MDNASKYKMSVAVYSFGLLVGLLRMLFSQTFWKWFSASTGLNLSRPKNT